MIVVFLWINNVNAESVYKESIEFQFDKISWQKIFEVDDTIIWKVIIDWNYIYYIKDNNIYRLEKGKKKEEAELVLYGSNNYEGYNYGINNDSNYYIQWEFLYYQNATQNWSLYKILKDWSQAYYSWTMILSLSYPYNLNIDYIYDQYVYYRHYDNYIYRVKNDWDSSWQWETIVSNEVLWKPYYKDGYVYYSIKYWEQWIYKARADNPYPFMNTSEKISNIISANKIYYVDEEQIYYKIWYEDWWDWYLYMTKLNWSLEQNYDIPIVYIWDTYNPDFSLNDEYIYYTDPNDKNKIKRIKYEFNETMSEFPLPAETIWQEENNVIMFVDEEYIYYYTNYKPYDINNPDETNDYRIRKIKKDGTEQSWTILTELEGYYYSNDEDYIYYLKTITKPWYSYGTTINKSMLYRIRKDGTDNNYYVDDNVYKSSEIYNGESKEFIKIKVDSELPQNTDYIFCISNKWPDNTDNYYYNYHCLEKEKLDWKTDLDLLSMFWEVTDRLYYEIHLIPDENDTTKTPIIHSVEIIKSNGEKPIQIPTPKNLKQYIQSPYIEKREEIQVWSKIGKFQSGSWVIFETEIDNPESKEFKIEVQIYEKLFWNTRTFKSSPIYSSWKKIFTIPLEAWDYTWKLRLEGTEWNTSDWVEFENNGTDIDFSIFEWFEPYPYGFSFPNSGISNWLLDWWIIWYNLSEDNTKLDFRYKNDWTKWEIFNYLFPESRFENKYKMFDIFESMWLDNKNPDVFYNWNCHWLSLISSTYKKDPLKINELSNDFYNIIGSWTIYDNISLSINWLWKWNKYDEKLKTILISQLAQYEPNFVFTEKYYRENKNPIDILNELKENPDKSYILSFWWAETENDKLQWHAVVPYRVEWNRIYIWDNNVPYPNYLHKWITYNAYEQYIEVYWDWKNDFKIKLYTDEAFWWTHFTDMSIVDLDLIYWKTENNAMWFNENDILYTLSWNSEILLKDDLWRISWYKDWQIYEEIPWTIFVRNYWVTLDNIYKENTWKQIYLPQKLENLTIEINGKTEENYDLMIAWGDYYTKLEWITTSSWQTDTFNISRENIKIDLDNTKTNSWTYNILVDDFQNNWTWTVMLWNLETINWKQELDINWTEVLNNSDTAVIYSKDLDNDGIQETIENLKPILDYSIEPEILPWNISWKIWLYLPQEICKKIWNKNCSQIVKQLEKEILNKTTKLILEKQGEWEEEIELNNKNKNKDKKQNKKWKDKNKEEKQYIELDNKWNYKIVDLEPWMYKISLELKKWWTTKTPNTWYYILEITNWENYIDKDFQVINKLLEQLIKNLKIK